MASLNYFSGKAITFETMAGSALVVTRDRFETLAMIARSAELSSPDHGKQFKRQ